MKTLLFLTCLFVTISCYSQTSKFKFGAAYEVAFTNVTHQYHYGTPYETGLWPVSNFFIRTQYSLSPKFYLTSGLGLMTAREFEYFEANGQYDIESIKTHRFHKYLVFPLGISYHFGSFFINPDFSVALKVGTPIKSEFTLTDGTEHTTKSEDTISDTNELTYPVSLSFGNEIKMKNCVVQIGVRGYYSLNTIDPSRIHYNDPPVHVYNGSFSSHYYGFGVFGGVSF